jgi:hypothetical protein
MKKVYLGHVGVDSGQLMITDPCYVRHFNTDYPEDVRIYRHKDDPDKTLQFGVDFTNYQDMIEGHNGQCMNQLLADGLYIEVPRPLDNSFSLKGASSTTLNYFGGMLQNGMAAVFQSGFGDGSYDVHAYVDEIDGWGERVTKVEITLIEEEA